jgi:hypothetical protein
MTKVNLQIAGQESEVPTTTLSLVRLGSGCVSLVGNGYFLLNLNSDGTIFRPGSISSELGFKLTPSGQLDIR